MTGIESQRTRRVRSVVNHGAPEGGLDDVQGLIFDLDGLLVDSEPIWFEVEGGFLGQFGYTWTEQQARNCMGQGTPSTLRIWQQTYGIAVDIERDTSTIVRRMIEKAPNIPLKKGVIQLLRTAKARDCPMAVASSSPRELIEAVLEAKGIREYFQAVASAQEVPRSKPAPDVFVRAAKLLHVPIERCVVLEDALSGVRGAIAAGARVIAVPVWASQKLGELDFHQKQFEILATWIVEDLEQAQQILFG